MARTGNHNPVPNIPRDKITGRPKGVPAKINVSSIERLAQLSFDPIKEMVDLYDEVEKELADPACKRGSMAFAALFNTKRMLLEALVAYGYRKPPIESVPQSQHEPIRIEALLTLPKVENEPAATRDEPKQP